MDETQRLDDSFMDDQFELDGDQARKPLAKLRVFKNEHIPETELPLYLGENMIGRDPTSCSLPLDARSVSKQHAVISLSVFPGDRIHVSPVVEALVWDLGSMNGTRKGRFRLTPHVRYALTSGDSVVLADLPCQYIDTSEVLREGSSEPKGVVEGGELPAKDRGRSLRTRMGKESESTEGGWNNGIKNTNLKGNVKVERKGNEMVTPSVVRSMSLSLAQTPACPENLHVLELDSDSDDSTRASKGPTCSTFLSPMNSIVPESEDENSVTPSSSVKDNSHQRMNQGGKGPATTKRKPQMLVYDSDSEFEERETLREKNSTTGLGDMANEQEGLPERMAIDAGPNGRAGPSGNVGMDKSEAGPSTDVPQPCKPCSQVSSGGGSHTAGNEEERKDPPQRSDPHSSGNNDPNKSSIQDGPSASKPSLSMDSDTDVECKEGSEQVLGPVSGTEATDRTCKSSRTSMVQPEEFHLDSDTDIEDNEDNALMSPSTISLNVKPSFTTVVVPAEFHLDSDTDSKGREDSPGDLVPPNPKPSTGLPEPLLGKCPGLHLSSDTDDEATDDDPFATSVRETRGKRGTQQPAGGREVDLKIDSSSDSDVESNATQLFAFTSKPELGSVLHQAASHSSPLRGAARGSSSDSDTDVEEPGSVRPGPGPRLPSVHLCLESDTDVEDGGEDGAADTVDGTDVLPVVGGAMASSVVDQKCSTPVTLRPPIPPVFPSRPSEGDQDDLKDDDFFIAETQSFVSEAPSGSSTGGPAAKRPCVLSSPPSSESSSPPGFEEQPTMVYSFQLGLSDSGHERPGSSSRLAQLGHIAEDELCATQAYTADTVTLSSGTVEMDRDLEATQAYVMEADGAVKMCADDIMNVQEVGAGEDHQRDFQANSHLSTADTQPVSVLEAVGVAELVPKDQEEEEEEGVKRSQLQGQRAAGRGNEEDKRPGRNTRSQRQAAVDQESQKRETRRISKAGGMRKGNGSRRKAVPDKDVESDVEEDESVQETSRGTRRTRGRKSQKKGKDKLMMSRGTEGNEGDDVRGEERENSERENDKRYKKKRKEQEEREERERLVNEKEQEEREEKERLEKERKEREQGEERERLEKEKEREEREEREKLEKERKEQEEKEERERLEKERKEQEEREEREKLEKERERLEKEKKEREERERLEKEKKEREEREEREKLEKERKEQEERERERLEKERLEKERKEQEEREEREKLEKERKERERLEKEKKEREERERLEKEKKEREEREEREKLEKERKEREERERLEKEREEREEREKLEKERREREERERLEKERLEKERKEQEEREETEKLEKERKERERLEREERERLEKEKREERERLKKEREERERLKKEREERERLKKEKEREEKERLKKEKKEREERERLEKEKKEREERERLEKEKKEREERERLEKEERARLEKEQEETEERERLEKEKKETKERERLEKKRKEQERLEKKKEREEKEERERLEEERKEQERLEKEQEEREERERLEEERKEKERLEKEQERRKNVRKGKEKREREEKREQVKEDEDLMKEQKRKSARGKRKQEQVCEEKEKDEEEEGEEEEQRSSSHARGKRTKGGLAVSADERRPCDNDTAMPEPNLRRGTRTSSRCNLVTSISSEKSTSSIGTQERSHLRKGEKENSQSGYAALSMQGEGNLASSGGMGSCTTSNSMGTSAERAMQTENVQENNRSSTTKGADTEDKETHHSSAKASQVLDRDVPGPSMNDGGDGKGGKVSPSDTATTKADQTIKDSEADGGKVLPSRSKSRSRSQKQDLKGVLDEVEQANSFKVPMDRRKSQRGGKRRGEELDGDETGERGVEGEIPQPAVRKGALAKKMKQEEREEAQGDQKEEQGSTGSVQLKSRGRQAVAQRKKESQVEMSEEQETKDEALDPTSEKDGPGVDTEVPQTPVGRGSRKRVASSKSPLAVKTPRRTSAQATSPTVLSGGPQAPKVLFTCVTDEAGEAALSRLGGSLARGVTDMTHLVTDRVRRTVKFLCAVARGVPVVTPCWLEKCSKNGAFLSPQAFLVKDVEQEGKFNFCLEEALQTAHSQPLLQGYEIHVTRSVKPDPAQMKDIITCSGARYLSRMPTVLKPQTVVISCAEDASLCGPALAASIPVLSAEFLLTGILQQRVDLVAHNLVGTGFGAPENETPKGRRKR